MKGFFSKERSFHWINKIIELAAACTALSLTKSTLSSQSWNTYCNNSQSSQAITITVNGNYRWFTKWIASHQVLHCCSAVQSFHFTPVSINSFICTTSPSGSSSSASKDYLVHHSISLTAHGFWNFFFFIYMAIWSTSIWSLSLILTLPIPIFCSEFPCTHIHSFYLVIFSSTKNALINTLCSSVVFPDRWHPLPHRRPLKLCAHDLHFALAASMSAPEFADKTLVILQVPRQSKGREIKQVFFYEGLITFHAATLLESYIQNVTT